MNPRLALYARCLRVKGLLWECIAEAACLAATEAFSRARTADGDAQLVQARASCGRS